MHIHSSWRCFLALLALATFGSHQAADAQAGAAVNCTKVYGALLQAKKGGGWDSIAAKSAVPADRLVVALFGGEFASNNGAVFVKLLADVGQRGPLPVLESALTFHTPKSADLEATLDRGISAYRNQKKSGTATLKLHVRGETFDVSLPDPKSVLVVEVYGRHPPGPAHLKNAKDDDPVTSVVFFAIDGTAVISTEKQSTRLQAPPGIALFMWDSLTRLPEVQRFDTLPDTVKPLSAEELKQFHAISELAKPLADKPGEIGKTLRQDLSAKDPLLRKVGVVGLGAVDDLPGLVAALNDTKHADVRAEAVLVVRHWLGRAPGQSIALYKYLTAKQGYTPVQAKSFVHLCHGIEPERRKLPGTFELLIDGLDHSKLPMRELCHWHLVRLAPAGQKIAYDAAAPEAERRQALEAWRRLIPDGQTPQGKQ